MIDKRKMLKDRNSVSAGSSRFPDCPSDQTHEHGTSVLYPGKLLNFIYIPKAKYVTD